MMILRLMSTDLSNEIYVLSEAMLTVNLVFFLKKLMFRCDLNVCYTVSRTYPKLGRRKSGLARKIRYCKSDIFCYHFT